MLGFFGAKAGSGNKYSKETGRAMEWIQTIWADANKVNPQYLHPGAEIPLPGVAPDLARM